MTGSHAEPARQAATAAPFIEVADLQVEFKRPRASLRQRGRPVLKAVSGVSFTVARGETVSILGESGAGKSTTGRAILQLPPPTSGKVAVDGTDMASLSKPDLCDMRRRMQMIFQDPYASVNRRMTVAEIIAEPMLIHEPDLLPEPRFAADHRGVDKPRTLRVHLQTLDNRTRKVHPKSNPSNAGMEHLGQLCGQPVRRRRGAARGNPRGSVGIA